ncbi:MAG: serine hydrolase [Salinisphaeraceae bacterium]|nr:serine hydrolase [Salinisphaeraceae bacterium]
MFRLLPYSLRLLLLALVTLLASVPALAAATYDVSYLWSRNLDSAMDYRAKVAAVLGPKVEHDLRVVQRGSLFGVIYHRSGSSGSAGRVAASHTRLLRARGLEPAAALRSHDWTFVDRAPAAEQTVAKAPPPAQAIKPVKVSTKAAVDPTPEAVSSDAVSEIATKAAASAAAKAAAKAVTEPVAKAEAKAETKALQAAAQKQSRRTDIEAAVEKYVKNLRARGVINRDERTAWSVYDFTTGEKLVDINEDAKFQAASLVKPFFAMAFFHQVRQGKLHYGPQAKRHMRRMIQYSNNYSTNWVMRQVGGPAAVQRILSRNYPGVFENTEIVEYIPAGGRTYRNKASVHDYSRFLYALWNENIPGADEIKRLMALPGKDRIFTGARSIPKGTQVYNKTGSTAHLCGDMGILVVRGRDGKRYPYTIIGVIEKNRRARNYSSWIRSRGNVIREVSNIVYDGITRHHGV